MLDGSKLIFVTFDKSLYENVKNLLSTNTNINAVEHSLNIADAETKASSITKNIFVIDVDYTLCTEDTLNKLINKQNTLVVLTGKSLANSLKANSGIKYSFIPKQTVSTAYYNALMSAIGSGAKMIQTSSKIDTQAIADVNTKIVVMASSTGGTEALSKVLACLPADVPPMLCVQHMPSGFTRMFADRLNKAYMMNVKEAENNDYVRPGQLLIAPADNHMALERDGSKLRVKCFGGKRIHGVIPAADVLFESVAPIMKSKVLGIILTGMGADGARGLYLMRMAGARTIGQNAETCVIYGMPKVAHDIGATEEELNLEQIAARIMRFKLS